MVSVIQEAQGVVQLVAGVKGNESILSIRMGEYGKLNMSYGRSCCTPPTYTEHMSLHTRFDLENCLRRNEELHQMKKWTCVQKAVIQLVTLLLKKINE